MRVDGAVTVAAALLVIAVLLWPRPGRAGGSVAKDSVWAVPSTGPGALGEATSPSLWHEDPVELFRRWRLRRRSGELVDDVLELLRGGGPALDAGLTPSRSIELAASAALGAERVARARQSAERSPREPGRRRRRGRIGDRSTTGQHGPQGEHGGPRAGRRGPGGWAAVASSGPVTHDIDRLVGALLFSAERAEALSPVWAHWAARSGSAELALVAAAWQLSETTGAPLSFAVDRAVRGLLDARARRRKVAVAVAGPRATVTVLTVLPLTGPLFGLAVGIDPRTLYLDSSLATACVTAGLVLVWAGRVWCTRMVRKAVRP
ncbi:MAG: type II secretion system F family protein [Terrabacter sp.]